MASLKQCDRPGCQNTYNPSDNRRVNAGEEDYPDLRNFSGDLCPDCYRALEKWWKELKLAIPGEDQNWKAEIYYDTYSAEKYW